jgi:hypothetical protein
MTKVKGRRWALVDGSAERLLDEIGASELEYYSAGADRAVDEALRAWPLLATVVRALRSANGSGRTREPTSDADPTFRVIVPGVDRADDGEPADDGDPADDPASLGEETGP